MSQRSKALQQILTNQRILAYVKEMRSLESCFGPVIEKEMSEESQNFGIHFIVCTKETYNDAYQLRLKHDLSLVKEFRMSRQVILKLELLHLTHVSNVDLEMIIHEQHNEVKDLDPFNDDMDDKRVYYSFNGQFILFFVFIVYKILS